RRGRPRGAELGRWRGAPRAIPVGRAGGHSRALRVSSGGQWAFDHRGGHFVASVVRPMNGAATRRAFLATVAGLGFAVTGRAMDRTPYGGALRVYVPLSLDGLDPHAGSDAASALFADAIADPLYAWDAQGRP